jgi:hypothetical protein
MVVCPRAHRAGRVVGIALAAAFAAAALGVGYGCGATPSTTAPTTRAGYSLRDGDRDTDDKHPPVDFGNDDKPLLGTYRGRPSPATARAVAGLVKRYYAASAAGEGARACALLASGLAAGVAAQYGRGGRSRGEGCATSMTGLLGAQRETLLGEDVATMRVSAVHLDGDFALAVLLFKTAPESNILLEREGRAWRIGELFGNYMP